MQAEYFFQKNNEKLILSTIFLYFYELLWYFAKYLKEF
jgi:hypothetical protein